MGKGDKRTKRGKIFAGSYGKYRMNPKKIRAKKKAKSTKNSETEATES
ncbi:MAG: 30S ribosomal protein THX [Planctomycetota bacterium]|nr:MAG: 30S ribosomal protein THX [Planctomycetota bacterium]